MKGEDLHAIFFHTMERYKRIHIERLIPELTKMEFMVMHDINCLQRRSEEKGVYVSELVKRAEIVPSAISRLLKGLEEKGYIVRETDRNNRRNTYVIMTVEGRTLIEDTKKRMDSYMGKVFAQLGEEKVMKFIELCDEMVLVMEQALEENDRRKEE